MNGAYIKEEITKNKDGTTNFNFYLIYSNNRARQYNVANKEEYNIWISSLKLTLESENILSKYTYGVNKKIIFFRI